MVLGWESLSWETWKTGCTNFIVSGSQSMKEWVPGCAIIAKGLRFLSESFLEGCIDLKHFTFM